MTNPNYGLITLSLSSFVCKLYFTKLWSYIMYLD